MNFRDLITWYPERDSNLHVLADTWPSTMPVYQFQHRGRSGKITHLSEYAWLYVS